ncbi:MAG: diaminopimelate decarboxylase [Ekhidna sp.]|nr:diaminopimelate decarboxylase [Ekhidna sp.]MBC6410932.1 diaminopimelate decarboxylase [Ekhidna sp.]
MENTALIEAATTYGSPLYIYDANQMKANYKQFTEAFNVEALKVHYACKALNNQAILKLFKSLGTGLDCVSVQEVQLGLRAGFSAENILFTPNNISTEEYEQSIALGVNINVDNLYTLEYFGMNHPDIPIYIRINPHLMAGGNQNISVGHIDSKFGISIHQVPNIERIVRKLNINVMGIHVHTGSDILDADVFIKAAELVFSVVERFDTVTHIDFGSGFKVAYKPEDLHTNIGVFGKKFSKAFNDFCERQGKTYTLEFEPGKYLVSNAGYFVAKANLIKQTTSCTFVGLNTGFNHLIRPMFYNAYHHIENLSNPTGEKKVYNVVGYVCETDSFASDRIIPEVRKGDLLVFKNTGAYCATMASNYNSRLRPAEVMLLDGKNYLIKRRETLEDLLRTQVETEINY